MKGQKISGKSDDLQRFFIYERSFNNYFLTNHLFIKIFLGLVIL